MSILRRLGRTTVMMGGIFVTTYRKDAAKLVADGKARRLTRREKRLHKSLFRSHLRNKLVNG